MDGQVGLVGCSASQSLGTALGPFAHVVDLAVGFMCGCF